MKKLEDELGVQLFNRTVNRISLTATGELAANEAQRLLDTEQDFRTRVTNFDKMQRYINIGSVAPGALLLTQAKQKDFQQALTCVDHLIPADRAEDTLREYRVRLILTDFESQADDVESM